MASVLKYATWAFATALSAAFVLFVFAGWTIAPYPLARWVLPETAERLLQAPFAERIVIGDSRVSFGKPVGSSLFIGYGGATFYDLERMTKMVCALSDAPVTVALGVNDARQGRIDQTASLASMDSMIAACGAPRLRFAQIWPVEPDVVPYGRYFDSETISAINLSIASKARAKKFVIIPAPDIADHTIDGVHFDAPTSARYMASLGSAD